MASLHSAAWSCMSADDLRTAVATTGSARMLHGRHRNTAQGDSMGILFINGGEIGGNTAHLGHAFLEGRDFTQIDLARQTPLLPVPGRRAHAADVRARRIHHQPLRRPVRYGLHGHGPQCKRRGALAASWRSCPRFRNLPADYRTHDETCAHTTADLAQARSGFSSRPRRSYRTE